MHRLVIALASLLLPLSLLSSGSASAEASSAPMGTTAISVAGDGVGMYPGFDPSISRYAVTTTDATAGTVTVSVAAGGRPVYVDGVPARGGTQTLTGLTEGDEISVFVGAGSAREVYSLIYLPVDFPSLVATSSGSGPAPGMVLMTLTMFGTTSETYETALDANGVPVYAHTGDASIDLKPAPGGGYTVARRTAQPGGTDVDIVSLDSAFQETGRRRGVGLPTIDTHDSISLPDGSIWVSSYLPRSAQPGGVGADGVNWQDAVVQHVSADGQLLFEWSSRDHVASPAAETTLPSGSDQADYAHLNSFQVVDGGQNLLMSFRHLSSVWKIAITAHDGYAPGDVVWKLGGRRSTFTFEDAEGQPVAGTCAQHTAYQIADDRVVAFDNGAWAIGKLCVDPNDPDGPPVARVPTRIAEWQLDEDTHVATLAWHYVRSSPERDYYAIFAGSAERLPSGNTLIGWASETLSVASEVDADGDLVWDLVDSADDRDPDVGGVQRYASYRAFKADVPDTQDPVVDLETDVDGATYRFDEQVQPVASCTDRGGSSLQTCDVPALDTSTAGPHQYVVTATDGAGNTATVQASYTVSDEPATPAAPDASVRVANGKFVGTGATAWPDKHRAVVTLSRTGQHRSGVLRVRNTGQIAGRFTLARNRNNASFKISLPGATRAKRSPVLAPGETWKLKFTVTRARAAANGTKRDFVLRLRSEADRSLRDAVVVRTKAVRPGR